jgi:polysaccharide chain length determinant protein (PEP-CTERM system associated)
MQLGLSVNALVDNLLEEVRGAWRFRRVALFIAWGVAIAAWTAIFFMPDTYQATARVFVDTKTALSEVTRGISVDSGVDTQIQRVRQALLGGPQLLKVAAETDLGVGATTPSAQQVVIDKLRNAIDISGSIGRDGTASGVFNISYKDSNRGKSLEVVEKLLNTFVEGALGGKREGSAQAQQFLLAQIADLERRLTAAEERLADFKRRNVGLMPGTQGDYFSRLQTETDGLSKAQASLGVAMRRRDELQRQLRGEQPFVTGSGGAVQVPSAPGGVGSDIGTRIRETQARLDELLLRFTDKHPDVISMRATLKELQARQQSEIDAARRGDSGAAARTGLAANPVFQNIQVQFNQAQVEIATIQADIADRERKMTSLRALLNTAPEVEANFAKLNRDYDVTRSQYQALLERLERARLGEEAEATGIVRFETIDPPSAAFAPIAPNRPMLIAAALIAALGAGGALAYLLHLLKPVFMSARHLSEATGLPVLGVVSMTWLEKYRASERRDIAVYAGAAAALVIVGAALLLTQQTILQLVRGLVV